MGHVPGPMSPRSEMMAREMDSIIFSPRGKDARMAMSALALSPRNVNLANLTKHMNGEDVPKFAGGVNAQLRARAAVQANFGIRTVQLLNPLDKQEPRDNPPFPNWWSGGYGASAQQTMSPRCLPQDGLDEPLPAAPPGPRPAGLPRRQAAPKGPTLPAEPPSPPPNDPAEEAAAAVLQREVRGHQAVRKEEARQAAKAATIVQARHRGAKDRKTKAVAVKDQSLQKWHKILQKHITTRFSTFRGCFRLIDVDSSGSCDRKEMKTMLNAMFNLEVPSTTMDQMIDLADVDGDGVVRFAEFARVFSADDILSMKKTLQAAGGNSGISARNQMREPLSADNHPMPIKVYNSHFAPGSYTPSIDASLSKGTFVPRGFPPGTDLAPPPRASKLQTAFRLGIRADRRSAISVWHPRSGPLALPAGKKSDVHQPLTIGWHPSQLGSGVDEVGTAGTALTMKWLGVKAAPE